MTINMEDIRKKLTTISVKLNGDRWCVKWGLDLQKGIVGFGDTPKEAMINFCKKVLFLEKYDVSKETESEIVERLRKVVLPEEVSKKCYQKVIDYLSSIGFFKK